MHKKSFAEKALSTTAIISTMVLIISLIAKLWLPGNIHWLMNRIWLSALIALIGSFVLYGLCCYKSEK